jgi:hypothetical protein
MSSHRLAAGGCEVARLPAAEAERKLQPPGITRARQPSIAMPNRPRMRKPLPLIAIAALLAACGSGTVDVPAGPDLTGTWEGSTTTPVVGFHVQVTDKGGSLSGTGRVMGVVDSANVTLDGKKTFRTVNFTLAAPGFVTVAYKGSVNADADSIVGTVSGSGYTGQSLILRHQTK